MDAQQKSAPEKSGIFFGRGFDRACTEPAEVLSLTRSPRAVEEGFDSLSMSP
ncbi:hypothetical protein BC792_1055 [Sphingobacterium allocomposti]|uniref:Uncharacterized protein n=1 Tax=Sphingobacterium allocomposti TaxID=415956 RepID=A0A5S5DMA4_9SPHI|nr:hypothetical protein BC792_1055 [Sphingobacterium composti Yoo et al. 2007 non Ten et al. 2007]